MTRKTQVFALVASLFLAGSIVKANEYQGEREHVETVQEQAGRLRETMTVPENSHTLEGQEAARKTMEQFNSPAFQEKLRCQMERIQGENPQQEQTSATQGKGTLSIQESVYIFLSSSVPEAMVNRYLIVALNETQPNPLPTRPVSAFTPGWEDDVNFCSQGQLGRGFTSNCAEFC